MDLCFDPDIPLHRGIPLLGIYSQKAKTFIPKNISTLMFIAAVFIITTVWKQPKCPSIGEWIKQLWNIYTMEYYLTVKEE